MICPPCQKREHDKCLDCPCQHGRESKPKQ